MFEGMDNLSCSWSRLVSLLFLLKSISKFQSVLKLHSGARLCSMSSYISWYDLMMKVCWDLYLSHIKRIQSNMISLHWILSSSNLSGAIPGTQIASGPDIPVPWRYPNSPELHLSTFFSPEFLRNFFFLFFSLYPDKGPVVRHRRRPTSGLAPCNGTELIF